MLRRLIGRRPATADAADLHLRLHPLHQHLHNQKRWSSARPRPGGRGRHHPQSPPLGGKTGRAGDGKSEWWSMDGEMHEIGDHIPHRERFVIPRDNLPNKRRKQMREQFMRRTRLVLKESEHEPWCRKYMEMYQELRENWERLYWDEGYSKKIAEDHADYESAEDDDLDFSPYRRRQSNGEPNKDQGFRANETWQRVSQVRDKFEYDRERRMKERAFAPMSSANDYRSRDASAKGQAFDTKKFFP